MTFPHASPTGACLSPRSDETMAVKQNQVYAELGGKKRYLRVEEVTDEEAICRSGWRVRNGVAWSHRLPTFLISVLEDTTLFRLETDA